MRRGLSIINLITLSLSLVGGAFLYAPHVAMAASPDEKLEPVYASSSGDDRTSIVPFIFSEDVYKTVTFSTGTKAGKVIRNLAWYSKEGTLLRQAAGDWLNKTSFSGSETIQGTKEKLTASGGSPYGGAYYWNRSGGSNTWKSGAPQGVKFPSSDACPTAPNDEWGLKAYPNCTDDQLSLTLTKSGRYTFDRNPTYSELSEKAINDSAIETSSIRPVDVTVAGGQIVCSGEHVDKCSYSDSSTQYLNQYKQATNKNQITIHYKQTFGSASLTAITYKQDKYTFSTPGLFYDYASPGARQIWYYAAFSFNFEGSTYIYNDKQLYVEWGDLQETPTPTPPPKTITGDFDIVPSHTINWRDSFTLKPKSFNLSASCTYQYHQYKIERDGSGWTSGKIYGRNLDSSFSYSSYPYVLGIGSHSVTLKITASCGDSGWISSKTLTVNGPTGNNPPEFAVGWTTPGVWTQAGVQSKVIVGTQLDLVHLDDPTPRDPDGDGIEFLGFDFTGQTSWAQAIPGKYDAYNNGYHRILMDAPGYFCARGTMRDSFGASSTRQACVEVSAPNPVPVIAVPDVIRENHPVTPAIHGNLSYSPAGRTIDHSRDIWTNRKSVYTAPGPQTITLDVFDSAGLKSLNPAALTVNVLPDEPPLAILNAQPLGIRQTAYDVVNSSISPDGDKIVSAVYRYRYDKNNNGFGDDAWTAMTGTLAKTTLTPMRVGKYEVEVTVTEDYGKSATASVIIDTVNQAPSVSFLVEGGNDIPQPDNKKTYAPQDILGSWPLYQTNTTTAIPDKTMAWSVAGGTLAAGVGRMGDSFKGQYSSYTRYSMDYSLVWADPLQNGGFGANTLNAYRAITVADNAKRQPLLVPNGSAHPETLRPVSFNISQNQQFLLRSTPSHIYYSATAENKGSFSRYGLSFMAMNKSKIGRYEFRTVCDGCYYPTLEHHYLDGSPFDYVLHPSQLVRPTFKVATFKDYNAMRNHDYAGARGVYNSTPYEGQVLAYEVSDKTVYQIIRWTSPESVTYVGDEDYYYDFDLMDIRTYDAVTGTLIQSTGLNGKDYITTLGTIYQIRSDNLFTKGDNLVYFDTSGTAFEFNRNGEIVKKVKFGRSLTKQPMVINGVQKTCNISTNVYNLYRGAGGEWYGWENATCNIIEGYESNDRYTYIYKLTPDYQIAWRTLLAGRDPNDGKTFTAALGSPQDSRNILLINPIRREVVARSYTINGYGADLYYQAINMDTGVATTYTGPQFTSISPKVSIPWTGAYTEDTAGWTTYTTDGYKTVLTMNSIAVSNASGQAVTSFNGGGLLDISGPYATATNTQKGGYYVGDGMYLAFYTKSSAGYEDTNNLTPWLIVGSPTTNTQPYEGFKLGQFVSTETVDNSDLTWTMTMVQPKANTKLAGMSFRMTDARNRYAVETDGSQLYLSKYVNGSRTVLQQIAFSFLADTAYHFKVSMLGNRIQAFVNGVPYFDKVDTKFTSGKFGPFTDKSYVNFADIARVQLSESAATWLTNFAIWEGGTATADVRYSNIVFDDPEHDPMAGNYQWTIQHTPKFLNNQGLSALNGKTLTSPALQFDKVGNYRITLKAQDDPHPDYRFPSAVFADYRKWSNEFWQIITVHRRPVAQFTLSVNPNDKTVVWNDTSYDPDRWQSATVYDTEATGIDYKTTRGILERKYFYISPSGEKKNEKLVTPQETGTYTVGLQVKDEYGAWSYWAEQTIAIATPVAPDELPAPGFTLSKTTLYRGETLSITSTAKDKEDGAAANLTHEYYIRNVTEGGAETLQSASRGTWIKVFNSLGVLEIRQVVCDSKGQCAQLVKTVTVINRAPTADFDWTPSPAYEGDEVHLRSIVADGDQDPLTLKYELTWPDGKKETMHFTLTSPYGSLAPIIDTNVGGPGNYKVKLTVTDGISTATREKTIAVGVLGIKGVVSHTDQWLQNIPVFNDYLQRQRNRGEMTDQEYNDAVHDVNDYFAGEYFVLNAVTSAILTGSNVHAEAVWTKVKGTAYPDTVYTHPYADPEWFRRRDLLDRNLQHTNTAWTQWEGLVRQPYEDFGGIERSATMEDLGRGYLDFTFYVRFSNGTVKSDVVRISVKHKWTHFYRIHRSL